MALCEMAFSQRFSRDVLIRATSRENPTLMHATNKGQEQPAQSDQRLSYSALSFALWFVLHQNITHTKIFHSRVSLCS